MVFGFFLESLGCFLKLIFVLLIFKQLVSIGFRGSLAERVENIHFALQLRFLDALGLEMAPLVGGFDLRNHRFV